MTGNGPTKGHGSTVVNGRILPDSQSLADITRSAALLDAPLGTGPAAPSGFVNVLVESGGLPLDAIRDAADQAAHEGLGFAEVLVRTGLIGSGDLAIFTALHSGRSLIDLPGQAIQPRAVSLVPQSFARRHVLLPIRQEEERLVVAMADPMDLTVIQDLAARTGCIIEPVVAPVEEILDHIHIAYRFAEGEQTGTAGDIRTVGGRITASTLRDLPAAEILEALVSQALQDRASDIHLEPTEMKLRVRFRIDGILHDMVGLPLALHPAVVSRLKIVAGLNIAEKRRPQDGQFSVEYKGRKVDVRTAVSNTVHGEMAVLRLLDKNFTLLGLEELGMNPSSLEQFRRLLKLPHGMIVVCGPTGSGKSTTLYASVLQMNRIERSVVSIEDPVEFRIPDTCQMQVNTEAGITFAGQLRSILRLDPNVILVGEIRDQETASVAIQASLTGHLVLSSLHANDSVSALIRLKDLGIPPYLIASSVAGIVAQRMVRVVCSSCKVMTPRPQDEQHVYASELGETRAEFLYGSGCNICAQTGYRGRTGVFENFAISDSVRQIFLAGEPRHRLFEQAMLDGLVPLKRDGMLKVKQGRTTPYEVLRTLYAME